MLCQSLQDSHTWGQRASCQVWTWMPALCAMPTSALSPTHRDPKQAQPLWFLTNQPSLSLQALPSLLIQDPLLPRQAWGRGCLPQAWTGCVGSWRS